METPLQFDLHRELTTNVDFNNKAQRLMSLIAKSEQAGELEDMKGYLKELLTMCEFNPSLLVPYFFPKFPDQDPMTLWSRPHAFSMMAFTPNASLTVNASRQIGKCLSGDTTVVTNSGIETMADIFEQAKQSEVVDSTAE